MQHGGDLARGRVEPGHDLVRRELQQPYDLGRRRAEHLGADGGRLRGVPAERLHADDEPPRHLLQQVDHVGGGTGRAVGDLGQPARGGRRARLREERLLVQAVPGRDRRAQPRQRPGAPGPDLRGAEHGEHEVDPLLRVGRLAEDVQAVADLDVLDLAQITVDVQHEVVERVGVGLAVDVQVVVELRGLDERPDLCAYGGQLGRVEGLHGGVLVQELF